MASISTLRESHVTTFSTTTVPYTDPVVQVPTQPSTDNVEPTLLRNINLYTTTNTIVADIVIVIVIVIVILAEDAPVFEANEEREVFRKGVETSIEDEHDGYVVSPIEEQGEERWPEVEGQKAGRPISGNIPLIFQWEKRAEQKRDSTTGTIGQTM
ncbi:predicted protein [Sclerotinia sclerotiorum 1980 UF-70]|uniref:Uncharacterized protein n=1 Tax=Sclerotinia sclerotiorum (strain ATCC 18683 / 1980 / Ss-1) TaxID=665079 RepID=A7EIA0_SCLS1|nr:predicted protein [Sclerotinia sclerotiorum 1980 UF-70]EDO02566.1 predicted protein [Sclerotinia sclerotiorum 1980 UF-70]